MAVVTREQIFSALFAKVSGSADFRTKERKLRLWGQVDRKERPYIGMAQRVQPYTGGQNQLPVRTYTALFFIYTDAKDVAIPAALLNPLLDAVDTALAPENALTQKCTLGGLVQHVYIDGDVFVDPGDLDGDGLAIIPVKILVP